MKTRKPSRHSTSVESPTLEEMKATLDRFKPLIKGKQVAIGATLGINQGQLSKILRGEFATAKGHAFALFKYAKMSLSEAGSEPADRLLLQTQLTQKLLAAWDGSLEGATALGTMLDAAARLRR